jgi:sugar O-acyltransferase (sialic acid O-acetyltransferase NeuD family)
MITKIIIIGGRGGAVVVGEQIYDAQLRGAPVEFLGYAFDDETLGGEVNGFPIHCKTYEANEKYSKFDDVKFIYQMWRPDLIEERIRLLDSFKIKEEKFATFVHPSALVTKSASIGKGSAIMANTVINPNAIIGRHCSIQTSCVIGHDSVIGDYNFIASLTGIGSNNIIGDRNFFGHSSSLNNKITVGDDCFIGMGSNVIKSIESGIMVVGNPAKPVEKKIKPL